MTSRCCSQLLVISILLVYGLPQVIYAQAFNPFASDSKPQKQSNPASIEFQPVALTGSSTEIPVILSPQAAVKIENPSIGNIYSISIKTETPGPLSLRILQLELDDKNQVKSQTLLARSDVNGGQATTLALPDTLLPTGSIFIGIGARGEIKGTLRIAVDSHKNSTPFKANLEHNTSDDSFTGKLKPNSCFKLANDDTGNDIALISTPNISLSLQAFGIGKSTNKVIEQYKGRSPLLIKGLSQKSTSKLCLFGPRKLVPLRLKTIVSKVTEEPNAQLDFANIPILKAGGSLTFNTFTADADVLRVVPAPVGKAHQIMINGVAGSTVCFRETKNRYKDSRECFNGVRQVGPMLGGDGYILEFSNIFPSIDTYTVTSKLIDFDETIDRYEPNFTTKVQSDEFATQTAPIVDPNSGQIRLKGSHISSQDTDRYHWADINKEQLWRVRAIGEGLRGGEILLDGKSSVRLTRPPGTSGRLVADDVFLKSGKATISLTGDAGNYTVFFRPLGAPPKGFELEDGADGKGQRLFFGKTISGQLRRGDVDRYRVSLTKPVAITLTLTPPLGASTRVMMRDVVSTTVGPNDPPLKLTIPAGDHILELKPKVSSPMDYSLKVDRRNPFVTDKTLIAINLEANAKVRAWSDDLQSVSIPLKFTNNSAEAIKANLVFETSTSRIIPTNHSLNIKPNETKTEVIELRTLPDLAPGNYSIMTGLRSSSGEIFGFSEVSLESSIGASNSQGKKLPALPKEIIGAVDMAHNFRGAKWINIEAGTRSFVNNLEYALDGLFIYQQNYMPTFRFGRKKDDGIFDLKLGAAKPIPLVGVGFTLVGAYQTPLEDIEIHTSIDGKMYEPWIKGKNDFFGETQYMTGSTRLASHVRLFLPASKDASEWTRTTEFHVFAEPGKSGLPPQDLLRHGYSAKRHLNELNARQQSIMKTNKNRIIKVGKLVAGKTKWLEGYPISFRNTMQASIESIELEWAPTTKWHTPVRKVKVMGANNLAGPWKEVGKADIPDPKTLTVFRYTFPEYQKVRFIRFDYEVSMSSVNFAALPAKTSVFEQAEGDGYISVLGEWDRFTKRTLSNTPLKDGGQLILNSPQVKGQVQFQTDEDNWTVDIPEDTNTLILEIETDPGFHPQIMLMQADATIKPTIIEDVPERQISRYHFIVTSNKTATISIKEDKRSTYILVKQSAGMAVFRSRILNGIVELSKSMVAGRDAIALSAMTSKSTPEWITDPDTVNRKLVDYFKENRDSGSDAAALTFAAKSIRERTGSKAILLIGDGEGGDSDSELEIALQNSKARLFIAKPPGSVVDKTYAPGNDVLEGWAQLGGGDVQYTTSLDDYEKLFSRVSAKLSGPKGYLISAKAEKRSLKPGFLNVTTIPAIELSKRADRTQIVLLDTSGSMLKRIGKTYRYRIARSALKDYVTAQENAKPLDKFDAIGLRIFGGPPAKCKTDIVFPPVPLDAKAFMKAVDKIKPRNNAKTPIAQALKSVADDISEIDGDVSLLLLTDGEETCGGDPLAEIKALAKMDIKIRLDVVSFALSDDIERESFKAWAEAGGGQYVDAQTDTDLRLAIKDMRVRHSYKILKGDEVILKGQVGTRSSALPVGSYDVIFDDGLQRYPIAIKADETLEFKDE